MFTKLFSILGTLASLAAMAGEQTEFTERKGFSIGHEHFTVTATGSFTEAVPDNGQPLSHFVFGRWAFETLGELETTKTADSVWYKQTDKGVFIFEIKFDYQAG